MKHVALHGWNIQVEQKTIAVQDPDGNGFVPGDGWEFTFTEVFPQTGNTVRFAFGRDVRDTIVRELTGGIVLHGGELPKL